LPITTIRGPDIAETIRAALQYIAVYHTPDYLAHLSEAYRREESPAARDAIGQILESSRLAALGNRPVCQDTGMVTVFARIGQSVVIDGDKSLADYVNDGVRQAYLDEGNPLRASMVADPVFDRKNTRDNTPAVTHVETCVGNTLELLVAAKGGGSEKFMDLNFINSFYFINIILVRFFIEFFFGKLEGIHGNWRIVRIGDVSPSAVIAQTRVAMPSIHQDNIHVLLKILTDNVVHEK